MKDLYQEAFSPAVHLQEVVLAGCQVVVVRVQRLAVLLQEILRVVHGTLGGDLLQLLPDLGQH